MHSLDGGLIHKALRDPTKAGQRPALLRLMSRALGLSEVPGNQSTDQQALEELEVCLLTQANPARAYIALQGLRFSVIPCDKTSASPQDYLPSSILTGESESKIPCAI